MQGNSYVLLLVVLYGAAFLGGFNENLANMALMSIMGEYQVDSITAQWLVTGYMIVATVMVMCMAFLYRRFNLRTLFFAGAAFTLVGSVLGLVANSFWMVLASRLVQAVGGGLFIPLMMNTILVVAPKNKLGTFMSIGGCMITFGPAFAPVVCGALVTAFGWHSIFAVPLILMAVLCAIGIAAVKNLSTSEAHLDAFSVCLSAVFLFTLSFGLAQLTINTPLGLGSLAVAVLSAAVFVWRQITCKHPLIDLSPMKLATFWPAIILVVVAMTITFSLSVLLPLYFEGALGMTAFMAGGIILIPVLLNAGCTLLGGRIMDSHGEWPLLPGGMLSMVIGLVIMIFASGAMSAPGMFVGALFAFAGVGLTFSPSQTAGLRTLPPQQNPFGVALMTTFVQVAACIGPSMFIGVMSSSEASQLAMGATAQNAAAQGFSAAIVVATVIAACGFAVAFAYALAAKKRAAQKRGVAGAGAASALGEAAQSAYSQAIPSDLAHATIDSVMQSDPYTIPANALVREAMAMLVDYKVSGMPLVDREGRPAGYVSDGDIMRYLADRHPLITSSYALMEAANNQTLDERLDELMQLPVSQIATQKTVSLAAGTPIKEACQILAQRKFKKLPVVDGGKVVGTVNRSDVLRLAMESYLQKTE